MQDLDKFITIGPNLEIAFEQPSRKAKRKLRKSNLGVSYSANLIVDIGGTAQTAPTITTTNTGIQANQVGIASGLIYVGSGGVVGMSVDMLNSDTFCNMMVQGQNLNGSGQLRIAVQTSDTDTSGLYTDPTSGLAQFPTYFSSGGILILNSGGLGSGVLNNGYSGQNLQSGFLQFAAFQRPGRYARAVALSGDFYWGPLQVGLVAQLHTTGSGGGFSYSPSSGVVNV